MTLLLAALALFAGALALVALEAMRPRRELRAIRSRTAAYVGGGAAPARRARGRATAVERLAAVAPRADADAIARKLGAAGLTRRISPTTFAAAKAAGAVLGAAAGIALAAAGAGVARGLTASISLGLVGLLVPDLWVQARARRRREQIQAELPNALDLLAVAVEAGLSLDVALARFVEMSPGPLADEFARTLGEIRAGEDRESALRRLGERVGTAEMAGFARAVARAERMGLSLAGTLRLQASETRLRRQTAAEEQAGKAPVKMLFPTVFLIFPALFVVVLGPALLTLAELF